MIAFWHIVVSLTDRAIKARSKKRFVSKLKLLRQSSLVIEIFAQLSIGRVRGPIGLLVTVVLAIPIGADDRSMP